MNNDKVTIPRRLLEQLHAAVRVLPGAGALLDESAAYLAAPPAQVNPGGERGAGGVPWRGEHLGPRGDL